ncbi:rhamnulokinase [Streptococcus suis]|uniref:rhamnulokinase n=1 Tax=Streptococcus suis TaxID=1307 RepID=UPI00192243FC|nr:rhamnulokinase [Streptococcus suis]MBL1126640.1 rhamnulokinase [Streptococcus suis]
MTYHVAIDIGASSGRVILANKTDGLELSEIHRFKNGFEKSDGHDRWDIDQLVDNVLIGLEKVKQSGVTTCTIGIDTWAVDYVLLDDMGELLGQPVAYRDARTQGAMEQVFQYISKEAIYKKTGIQFLNFNTLYQFFVEDKSLLEKTAKILMIPDYIAYRLTGKMTGEVTNWSTTQFMNLETRTFDKELLEVIGIENGKFPDLIEAGGFIGRLEVDGYDLPEAQVIAVGTHDTASAVVGVPATSENWAYISSGTWSLIGIESKQPIANQDSYLANYTNEWGAYQTYRFLKNITGMWCVQEIARLTDYRYSFKEMAEQAALVEPFQQEIDLNDERFTNPENMIEEIKEACRETGQKVPESIGELVMAVYSNLAKAYGRELKQVEALTGQTIDCLHIVGGGSNISLLNQLTANVIGKEVIAGPGEATAIGNILVQMIATGEFENLQEARQWLAETSEFETFIPQL